jgi:hypothetical protein
MADQRGRGISLRGDEPKRLELSDGSRLMLDGASAERTEWRRLGRRHSDVSVSEAADLAGDEFAGYVEVRTRAEVEWLRAVADWYRQQADRLGEQLAESNGQLAGGNA